MLRTTYEAITLWREKRILCPDILIAWMIAGASIGAIVALQDYLPA
jgi:hypothetical protein